MPVQLDLTPAEVAARLRHLPGLVFFDSSMESGGELSIVAAEPVEICTGSTDADWEIFREKLEDRLPGRGVVRGGTRGMAAGSVDYDGHFRFGIYEDALIFQHANQKWYGTGDLASRFHVECADPGGSRPVFAPEITRDEFCAMVERAKEYIAAGDIYQVNLSQRFSTRWEGNAWRLYEALRHYSPAPYAAWLNLGGRTVISSSPELFLQMSGKRICTRPIKGTRPRHADAVADELSAYDLITSPKEIAELVMITDLERSDLGRVCEYGSVRARNLLQVERYEQVFHLVSTVIGELREDVGHVDALRSCFPGGSITGAPKKRAREIIAELEPAPRGLYTGAIGYFGFNGESQFNIAIRTVVVENGMAHFHTGAGIVADSIPAKEYEETLHKAAGILMAAERME